MANILVTGANRGIGLELVKFYLSHHHHVIACVRDLKSATILTQLQLQSLTIHELDLNKEQTITSLYQSLSANPIDIVINNAGMNLTNFNSSSEINYHNWQEIFHVNAIAPIILSHKLLPNLKLGQKKLIVNISSIMASIQLNQNGGAALYRASKSALNALTKTLSYELRKDKITVIALHPGWVKTKMGGEEAPLTAEESAKLIADVISNVSFKQSGEFINYNKDLIPW